MTLQIELDRRLRAARKRLYTSFSIIRPIISESNPSPSSPRETINCDDTKLEKSSQIPTAQSLCFFIRITFPMFFFLTLLAFSYLLLHYISGTFQNLATLPAGAHWMPLRPPPPTTDVSLICACRNRHRILQTTLSSYLSIPSLSEIILVDWSSNPPYGSTIYLQSYLSDNRVKVVRVENESSLSYARAYNVGMSAARGRWYFGIDCDIKLVRDIISDHLPKSNMKETSNGENFWTAHESILHDAYEGSLQHSLLVPRDPFLAAEGFDERISTMTEGIRSLTKRLEENGLHRKTLNRDAFDSMIENDDTTQNDACFSEEISKHMDAALLFRTRPNVWNRMHASRYKTLRSEMNRITRIEGYLRTPLLGAELPLRMITNERRKVLERLLHEKDIPLGLLSTLSGVQLERLSQDLRKEDRQLLVIQVEYSLAHRLLAMGSGIIAGRARNRVVVIIWEVNRECGGGLYDIFDERSLGRHVIVGEQKLKSVGDIAGDSAWENWIIRNENEKRMNKQDEEMIKGKHVYIKASDVIGLKEGWNDMSRIFKDLVISNQVRQLLKSRQECSKSIGIHMEHLAEWKYLPDMDTIGDDDEVIQEISSFWKSVNSAKMISQKVNHDDQVIITGDDNDFVNEMRKLLPQVKIWSKKSCYHGDKECVQNSMADIVCLSQSRMVLGAMKDEVIDILNRWGGKVYYGGIDFGGKNYNRLSSEAKSIIEKEILKHKHKMGRKRI